MRNSLLGHSATSHLAQINWYAKRAFFPFIRGLSQFFFFKSAVTPPLIAKRVEILYRRKISLGKLVYIGSNSFINAYSRDGITLGNRVTIREYGYIQGSSSPKNPGEGLKIGDNVYIGPRSNFGIGGEITIGAATMIGADFTVVSENHSFDQNGISPTSVTRAGIIIGSHCWIGHRVTILDGVMIGDNTVIGAGSVVTKSFPVGSRIAGVPAKCL
jgi:acetyltransferase-like isoleucine patch superfamily enzyme